MVNKNIAAAIENLRDAREEAPLGTGMMIDDMIAELQRIQETHDSSQDTDN